MRASRVLPAVKQPGFGRHQTLDQTYLDWVPVHLGKEIVMEVLDDVG